MLSKEKIATIIKLKCKNLLCITWDFEREEEVKGKKVKFLPLWKWLLEI